MGTAEIADIINENNFYQRGDGMPLPAGQVSARVSKHPHMFVRIEGRIHIIE